MNYIVSILADIHSVLFLSFCVHAVIMVVSAAIGVVKSLKES